mmetsp:Transcript_16184/g.34417  ORF Transcript_16184/g.34417 Transcript_16184/m.34417 type:complete len:372 (+) Transcript_16184:92-1207(+)
MAANLPLQPMQRPMVIDLIDSEDEAAAFPGEGIGGGASSSENDGSVLKRQLAFDHLQRQQRRRQRRGQPGGSSAACAIDLDDAETHVSGPSTSSGSNSSKTAEACCLCNCAISGKAGHKLHSCGHEFHKKCLQDSVKGRLNESMADELHCPTCGEQMSIKDVQDLCRASNGKAVQASIWPRLSHLPPHRMAAALGSLALPRPPSAGKVAGSAGASKRLLKELKALHKVDSEEQGLSVEVPDDSDLYTWEVSFFNFERGTPLARDLERFPGKRILLRVLFPSQFPTQPPYIRVIRPRFAYRTGHVTLGGSICTEMLTNQGWSPLMSMESVLMAIRSNMVDGGARLNLDNTYDYSEEEAKQAFTRMMLQHGWY